MISATTDLGLALANDLRPIVLRVARELRKETEQFGVTSRQATLLAVVKASPGLTLRGLTDQDRARLGVPSDVNGALVVAVEPDSAAADKGLEPGDVITRVNQKPVTSANAAVAALKTAKKDKSNALLLVRRGDAQRFVALSFS